MRLLCCGDSAVLVEVDDLDEVLGLDAAWRAEPPPGLVETVPAARTVLVRFDPTSTDASTLASALAATTPWPVSDAGTDEVVEIPTVYDGEDLDEVAELAGLEADRVVGLHAQAQYTVAFCGFAPGFGYLTGLDPRLHIRRRDTPRTAVPAGAVAVAGEFAAVYPHTSPGGWRIVGRTDIAMFSLDRDPPALLRPGVRVRFARVDG
ncbi:MAG: 5-oxoprolinase subunit B family protein [Actinomycetes bacterium]